MHDAPITRILRIKGLPTLCDGNQKRLSQFFSAINPIQIRQCKSAVFVEFYDERSATEAKASLEALVDLKLQVTFALPSSSFAYPKPTANSLASIFEVIATNYTLYTKVLDSMNSLNLPSPFHTRSTKILVVHAAQHLLSDTKTVEIVPIALPTWIDGRTRLYLKNVDCVNFEQWIQKFEFYEKCTEIKCFAKGKMRNQAFLAFVDAESCTLALSVLRVHGQDVAYSHQRESESERMMKGKVKVNNEQEPFPYAQQP